MHILNIRELKAMLESFDIRMDFLKQYKMSYFRYFMTSYLFYPKKKKKTPATIF